MFNEEKIIVKARTHNSNKKKWYRGKTYLRPNRTENSYNFRLDKNKATTNCLDKWALNGPKAEEVIGYSFFILITPLN